MRAQFAGLLDARVRAVQLGDRALVREAQVALDRAGYREPETIEATAAAERVVPPRVRRERS